MNDWLSGRDKNPFRAPASSNANASGVRQEIIVNINKQHQKKQTIACFGSVTGLTSADVVIDRFKTSSHRSGVSSSYNNALSSSVLNGDSKAIPNHRISKDVQAFNDQSSGSMRVKSVKAAHVVNVFKKINADPIAAQSNTATLRAEKRSAGIAPDQADYNVGKARGMIRKRQRTVLARSESAPVHLEDWLGVQMAEYQEDTKPAEEKYDDETEQFEDEGADDYYSDSSDGDNTFERICYNDAENHLDRHDPVNIEQNMIVSNSTSAEASEFSESRISTTAAFPLRDALSAKEHVSDSFFVVPSANKTENEIHVLHTKDTRDIETIACISLQLSERRKDCMSLYVTPRLPATRTRHFELDPKKFSQFPFTRGMFPKQLDRWPHQLHVAPVKLRRVEYSDNLEVRVFEGCSCVRFDSVGALVAVGSSNGVVRIFDFDECLAAMHGPSKRTADNEALSPIISTPPGPAVTDVRWSIMSDSELAVAFAHRAEVYIYDLYRCQKSRAPLRVLQTVCGDSYDAIAAARREGGNKVICYLNTPSKERNTEWLAAGGQSGCIHLWEVSSNAAHNSPIAPTWKISAEVASLRRSAIIGLCPVGKYRMLSASVCGTFAIWDLLNLAPRSFGKQSSPTLLFRIAHNLSSPLSGVTVPSFSGVHSDIGGKIYATLCSGTVHVLQVWCRYSNKEKEAEEEWSVTINDAALVARPLRARSQSSSEVGLSTNVAEPEVFHAPPCVLMPSGPSVFVASSYPHNKLDEHWLHVRNTTVSMPLHITQRSCVSTPILLRGDQASFTLPGSIVNALPGERAVTVSHDLRSYLCSDLISHSFPSRSSRVLFAWHSDLKVLPTSHVAGLQKLDGIDSHTLLLQEPYMGPRVRAGIPCVRMRTNLVPSSSSKSPESRRDIKSDIFVRAGSAGATVMDAHPCLPYILIGTRADEIHVLTATHDSDVAFFETSSATMNVVSDQNTVWDAAVIDSPADPDAAQPSTRTPVVHAEIPTNLCVHSMDTDPAVYLNEQGAICLDEAVEDDIQLHKSEEIVSSSKPPVALAPARTLQLSAALRGYSQNRSVSGAENRLPQRRMSALEKNLKGKVTSTHKVKF